MPYTSKTVPYKTTVATWYTITEDVTPAGKSIPTSVFPYLKFSFPEFNPLQASALDYIYSNNNILVSAPTASGKTTIMEMLMAYSLANNQKCIYISPQRILSNEKLKDWKDRFKHISSNQEPLLITGDANRKRPELDALIPMSNIYVMTNESLLSVLYKYSAKSARYADLSKVGCIIIDEAHIIGEPKRGAALEIALILFANLFPNARICFFSATIPNAHQLASWISFISNKHTDVILSNYKPCKVDTHIIEYVQAKYVYDKSSLEILLDILSKIKDQPTIIFVPTIGQGFKLQSFLKDYYGDINFVFSKLAPEQREYYVNRFIEGKDKIIISTSAMAAGVNTPAKNVIIVDPRLENFKALPTPTIIQEIGRAGRPQYDPYGSAFIIIPKNKCFDELKQTLLSNTNAYTIESDLSSESSIIKHILISLFAFKTKSIDDYFYNVYSKTLYFYSKISSSSSEDLLNSSYEYIKSIFEKMLTLNIIRKDKQTKNVYYMTPLGKAIMIYHLEPFAFVELYNTLYSEFIGKPFVSEKAIDILASSKVTDIILTQPTKEELLALYQMPCPIKVISSKADFFKALVWAITNRHIYYKLYSPQYNKLYNSINTLSSNIGRYMSGVKLVITHSIADYRHPDKSKLFSDLYTFTFYVTEGIPEEICFLSNVRSIAEATIRHIYECGFTSFKDIISNKEKFISLVGPRKSNKIFEFIDSYYLSKDKQNDVLANPHIAKVEFNRYIKDQQPKTIYDDLINSLSPNTN